MKIFVVLACMVAIGLIPRVLSYWRDLPRENLLDWIILDEDTRYGPSFSERKFARIEPGMRKAEVMADLGPPLRIIENSGGRIKRMIDYVDGRWVASFPDLPSHAPVSVDKIFYYYSQPGNPKADWYMRIVEFDVNGVIREVTRDVYMD